MSNLVITCNLSVENGLHSLRAIINSTVIVEKASLRLCLHETPNNQGGVL